VVTIVFEAAATSIDTERWLASGWRDSRLSAAGKRQAVELRRRWADEELAAVFCSDLAHASETARIAFGARGVQVLHDWRLRDCDFGDLAGRPVAGVEQLRAQHVYEPFAGGESYADVAARVRSFLGDVGPRYPERRVAVVAHPATKLAFDHVLEGIPLPELVATPFRWQPGWLYSLAVDI
jgi:2,3-bisphosphoglycerate-dependent phosphoglycerate mutase